MAVRHEGGRRAFWAKNTIIKTPAAAFAATKAAEPPSIIPSHAARTDALIVHRTTSPTTIMINGAESRIDERTDDLYEGTRKVVAGDGNCFFAVIARATGLTPEKMRKMIATWLKTNAHRLLKALNIRVDANLFKKEEGGMQMETTSAMERGSKTIFDVLLTVDRFGNPFLVAESMTIFVRGENKIYINDVTINTKMLTQIVQIVEYILEQSWSPGPSR